MKMPKNDEENCMVNGKKLIMLLKHQTCSKLESRYIRQRSKVVMAYRPSNVWYRYRKTCSSVWSIQFYSTDIRSVLECVCIFGYCIYCKFCVGKGSNSFILGGLATKKSNEKWAGTGRELQYWRWVKVLPLSSRRTKFCVAHSQSIVFQLFKIGEILQSQELQLCCRGQSSMWC